MNNSPIIVDKPDHPLVGVECPACGALFAPGDEVSQTIGHHVHQGCARRSPAEVVERFVRVVDAAGEVGAGVSLSREHATQIASLLLSGAERERTVRKDATDIRNALARVQVYLDARNEEWDGGDSDPGMAAAAREGLASALRIVAGLCPAREGDR